MEFEFISSSVSRCSFDVPPGFLHLLLEQYKDKRGKQGRASLYKRIFGILWVRYSKIVGDHGFHSKALIQICLCIS